VGDVITPTVGPDRDHVYHLYVIRTENRDALREHLSEAGISTILNYPKALPFYPAYAYLGHVSKDFPAAYFNQSRILSLPIYPEMPEETMARVANTISHFWNSECSKVSEPTVADLIAIEHRTQVLSDN
jgi:dTDP-4-amino-4,6-dideoxygalactose transaminase